MPTVTKWLNVLEASYVIYRLRPYYNNFGKRQTKAPKIYFTETGLAAYLIGIRESTQLFRILCSAIFREHGGHGGVEVSAQ